MQQVNQTDHNPTSYSGWETWLHALACVPCALSEKAITLGAALKTILDQHENFDNSLSEYKYTEASMEIGEPIVASKARGLSKLNIKHIGLYIMAIFVPGIARELEL